MRIAFLRVLGASIGDHVYLFGGSEILSPSSLALSGRTHVGRFCQLDARGGLTIGFDVVIAGHCLLLTADHDLTSPTFAGRLGPIVVGDRVWVGNRATVLRGVTLGTGSVVAAGSVVTRDVPPWTVVAGVPARFVRERPVTEEYSIDYGPRIY